MTDPRDLLTYNPETGEFRWKVMLGRARVGALAGTVGKRGYRYIRVDGRRFMAHRLAFLFMTGAMPDSDVDHRNCNRADNRWINLRLATSTQNKANTGRRQNNTSGLKGVSWHRGAGRWLAQISVRGQYFYLGLHATKEAAAAAYDTAAIEHFGEFARVNGSP